MEGRQCVVEGEEVPKQYRISRYCQRLVLKRIISDYSHSRWNIDCVGSQIVRFERVFVAVKVEKLENASESQKKSKDRW